FGDGPLAVSKLNAASSVASAISAYVNTIAGTTAIIVRVDRTDENLEAFNFGSSTVGSITTNGAGVSYGSASDQRLKGNIATAAYDATWIGKINVRQFTWNS